MAFKRKRVYAPKRVVRRKGFKSNVRRRKSWSTTSKSGVASSYRFRAKRLSRRSWNSMLWRASLQKTHYRSNGAGTAVLNTNIAAGTSNVGILNGLQVGANAFWTSAGGTQPHDTGATVPNFNGDIILRGGTIGMTMANDTADVTPQRVEIFLIRSGPGYDSSGFPSSVPMGYDPSLYPDFKSLLGRVVLRKEVILENVNAADLKFRLPVMKIDQADYAVGNNSFHWIIFLNSPSGTSSTITVTHYFNLSFAADAV